MITKKERIELRSKAQALKPIVLVGIGGFSENVIKQIDEELFNHELIKIGMQENTPVPTEFELTEMAVKLGAEVVTTIGKKIVLYRHSEKKGLTHALEAEKTMANNNTTHPSKDYRPYRAKKGSTKTQKPAHGKIANKNSNTGKFTKTRKINKTK